MGVEPEAIIRTSDIIVPEQTPLTSFADIEELLDKRSALFTSRLAAITTDSERGYQNLSLGKDNMVVKTKPYRYPGELFTGRGLCIVAAVAVRDGLRRRLNREDFTVSTVSILTDFSAENWSDTKYRSGVGRHEIAAVKDIEAGNTLYVDPTYAQVDHRKAGKIVCIPDPLLEVMYSNPARNVRKYMRLEDLDASCKLNFVRGDSELQRQLYQSLVKTIAK